MYEYEQQSVSSSTCPTYNMILVRKREQGSPRHFWKRQAVYST